MPVFRFIETKVKYFATLYFLGYKTNMPGTLGSLVGLIFGAIMITFLSLVSFIFIILAVFVLSYLSIKAYTINPDITGHDPKEVIIDEVIGQLISMVPLLIFIETKQELLIYGTLSFFLFRFFDILKPWPIYIFDESKGPLGVILDDIAAGILASLVLLATFFWAF